MGARLWLFLDLLVLFIHGLYRVGIPLMFCTHSYPQLSKMRFASVSEFKGKKYVNIREYYEKDGDLLPGKKGKCYYQL